VVTPGACMTLWPAIGWVRTRRELLRDRQGIARIGLYLPGVAEIRSVAGEFDLHPLAVEDAIAAHQRAKLERYDDLVHRPSPRALPLRR
jgi:hypothetical protein